MSSVHFLHANGWPLNADDKKSGDFILHYEGGVERTITLIYAENIWNWWDWPGQTVTLKPGTTIAWRGRNPCSDRARLTYCFSTSLANPRPNSVIASIAFRSRDGPLPYLN